MGKNKKLTPLAIVALTVVVLSGLGGGGYYLYTNFVAQSQVAGFSNTVSADYLYINCTDKFSGDLLDDGVKVTPYYYSDISEYTEEQLADLRKSDFTAGTAETDVDATDKLDLKSDEYRVFLIELTGFTDFWLMDYSAGVVNEVQLVNQSTSVNSVAFETDGGSQTLNQTNDRKWTFQFKAVTNDTDYIKGYPGLNWDWDNYAWNMTGIRYQFNTTAKASFFSTSGSVQKSLNSTYGYSWFTDDWRSDMWSQYTTLFSSTLGVDFEVLNAIPVWGSPDGDIVTVGSAIN